MFTEGTCGLESRNDQNIFIHEVRFRNFSDHTALKGAMTLGSSNSQEEQD